MKSLKSLGFVLLALAVVLSAMTLPSAAYETAKSSSLAAQQKAGAVLITDVRVFDGQNEKLSEGMSVMAEGNKIVKIGKSIPAPTGAALIDAGGRVMTPGFIAAPEENFDLDTTPIVLGQSAPGGKRPI